MINLPGWNGVARGDYIPTLRQTWPTTHATGHRVVATTPGKRRRSNVLDKIKCKRCNVSPVKLCSHRGWEVTGFWSSRVLGATLIDQVVDLEETVVSRYQEVS